MEMLNWKRIGVAAATGLTSLIVAGASMAADQTVKVGMVVGLSGAGADIGESMVRGADLYVALHSRNCRRASRWN
jgi:branched-chain amino acid transport system substrate-binding protein